MTHSGDLDLDGNTLFVSGGFNTGGRIKGANGQLLWADHDAVTRYDDGSRAVVGTIFGGMVAQLQ